MARTAKKKIGVFDEGVEIVSDVDSFDFVGDGVSATAVDKDVTVNIAGDTSGTIITITGTIDDSNTSFTAASEPTELIINGGTYRPAGGSITWSYLAGAITLSKPVGTGGSIYGKR